MGHNLEVWNYSHEEFSFDDELAFLDGPRAAILKIRREEDLLPDVLELIPW